MDDKRCYDDILLIDKHKLEVIFEKLWKSFLSSIILFFVLVPSVFAKMDITKAVIHHTDSHDVSWEEIDKWHKERGWKGIGYHFVIRRNGAIEKGRPTNKKGAHAKGRNHWIGIALTGRKRFTIEQSLALRKLLKDLKIVRIERHHEQCPGKGINIEAIQKTLGVI